MYCERSNQHSELQLTISTTGLDLPEDSTIVNLENNGRERLETPILFRWFVATEGGWDVIESRGDDLVLDRIIVGPNEEKSWTITTNTRHLEEVTFRESSRDFSFRFTPGEYVFGCAVTPGDSNQYQFYTITFSVTGSNLTLVRSEGVTTTRRAGNTLIVRTEPPREFEHDRRVSLLAERVRPGNETPVSVTRFELYNPLYSQRPIDGSIDFRVDPILLYLLRNGLASVRSSDARFRIETRHTAVPPLGIANDQSHLIDYEDDVWKISSEEGWGR